jgi:hypothetical protein
MIFNELYLGIEIAFLSGNIDISVESGDNNAIAVGCIILKIAGNPEEREVKLVFGTALLPPFSLFSFFSFFSWFVLICFV